MKNRVQHELDDLYDQCLQKAFQQKLVSTQSSLRLPNRPFVDMFKSDFPADVRQCEVEYMRTLGGEEMRGHTKETKEAIQKLIDDKYYNCRRALVRDIFFKHSSTDFVFFFFFFQDTH